MTSLRSAILCATAALVLSASQALAGPPDVPVAPRSAPVSPWEFRLEPYAWLTGLSGTAGIAYEQLPVDLSFRDIAQNLKMALAGQFEVRYNRLGLLTDFFYSDIGGSIPVRDPRIQQLSLDTKLFLFQVLPNYRVWRSDKGFFDVLAGIRGWDAKLRITNFRDIGPVGRPNFIYEDRSRSKAWVDFVGGVRGQYFLYQGLFVAAYGDIGGGSSALTWQVQGTLGYKFSKLISAELGWRLLSDDYRSGGFTYNLKQQGIFTGVSFTF